MMKRYDFLVVGAGIFGLCAAITLRQRGHKVGILNPGTIPHPLAASTDISKVVRMEYGADLEYMKMVDAAIDGWHTWNDFFQDDLYYEVGFLMLSKFGNQESPDSFESASFQNLLKCGHHPQEVSLPELKSQFPAFADGVYSGAIFNSRAGFAESGRVVETLAKYARHLGVDVHQGQTADRFEMPNSRMQAVHTLEGAQFVAGHVLVCAGAYTPYLLPELMPMMRATGHPVFHVQPSRPELFQPEIFPVFTSDISKTGWYGFPIHPIAGVVKIGNHGVGLDLHPERDERVVGMAEVAAFREFLKAHIPALADDPIVFTRRCLYSDTLDGHFWIDRHPEVQGLTVAAGGSGHGFKMAPILGDMIADVAEGGAHKWSPRYRWRKFSADTKQVEEARFKYRDGIKGQ